MGHIEHENSSPRTVHVAVITVSDSRTADTDESGALIKRHLIAAGHHIHSHQLLPNDAIKLAESISNLLSQSTLEAIIITGGTGLSVRDITVETIDPFFDKTMDGFGELFRSLSFTDIGPAAVLSRATGGVAGGKVVLCLPGSIKAVGLALEKIIMPELPHMVREVSR